MIFQKEIAKRDQIDLCVLKQLMCVKFVNARRVFIDKFFNFSIWAGCTLLVTGYLMKSFGLTDDFGPFQLGGILAGVGIFELYGNAVTFVSDLEGDRAIAYYLTLPTHTITVLCSHILYYASISIVMSLATLPLAKLILWNNLKLLAISWPRLLFFIVLINLFCATATLLLSAIIPSMDKFDILWVRIMFPLWFLGGFQFSWYSVNQTAPKFSYLLLLNPFLYMAEGIRAALLNKNDTIPFWICCAVLIIAWIGVGLCAYKTLKKRLDFV